MIVMTNVAVKINCLIVSGEITEARSSAIAVMQDPLIISNRKIIAALALKNRLPAIYARGDFVESGGLMSYGADQTERYRRVAVFVDKILKGTKPADLPRRTPEPRGYHIGHELNRNDTRIINPRSASNRQKTQSNFFTLPLLCQT